MLTSAGYCTLRFRCAFCSKSRPSPAAGPRPPDSSRSPRRSPRKMLPLVDKPIIQYGVGKRAVAAGNCQHPARYRAAAKKNAIIEDHFDVSVELESFLEARGKRESARGRSRKISNMINFAYVRQGEPLGLGHAVLVTRDLVGDEPFAVILADDVIDADPPAIKQLIDVFDPAWRPRCWRSSGCRREGHLELRPSIAIEPNASLGDGGSIRFAISRGEATEGRGAVGTWRSSARYVLTPDVFPALATTKEWTATGGNPADQRPCASC